MAIETETEREALVAVIREGCKGHGWLPADLPGDIADAMLAAGWTCKREALREAEERAHYASGVAELAMKHRDIAEDRLKRARLDLRDWFAGQALAGLLSGHPDADCGPKGYAHDAFVIANAMLAARGKENE